MPRVPYLNAEDFPADYRYLLTENSLGPLNLFRAIGNNPAVLQSYMRYGTTLWRESGLTDREVEVVILGVASELESTYVWQQHVPIAMDAGITPNEIRSIHRYEFGRLESTDQLLAEYVVRVIRGTPTQPLYQSLEERFNPETIVGITMLAAHYLGTVRALESLGVTLEEEFIGWDLDTEPRA